MSKTEPKLLILDGTGSLASSVASRGSSLSRTTASTVVVDSLAEAESAVEVVSSHTGSTRDTDIAPEYAQILQARMQRAQLLRRRSSTHESTPLTEANLALHNSMGVGK